MRIVLDERNNVLKFERGPLVDASMHELYVIRGSRALRVPVALGASSVSEIEVLRGLTPGDQVVISDMRDFNRAPEVALSN